MANIIKQLKDSNGNNIYPIGYAQGGVKIDLLWTNPSPSSSFASQTISLDLSDYEMVLIEGKYATETSGATYTAVGRVGTNRTTIVCAHMASSGGNYVRQFTPTTTGVYFYDGFQGGAGTKNDANIPWRIYGIKMSYIVPTVVNGLQYIEV